MFSFDDSLLDRLIILLLGFVIGVSCCSFLHNLLTLISQIGRGFQLMYFRYLFLDFTRQNGELQRSFCKFTPVCQCICVNKERIQMSQEQRRKDDVKDILGSLLRQWILGILAVVLAWLLRGTSTVIFLFVIGVAIAFVFSTVSYTINAVPILVGIDNSLMRYVQKISQDSLAGIPLAQMNLPPLEELNLKRDNYSERVYQSYRIQRCIEMEDYDAMQPLIMWMETHLSDDFLKHELGLYYDIIHYYSCINMNHDKVKRYYKFIEKELLRDEDSNGRRVLAYYQYYVEKDAVKALETAKDGINVLSLYEGNSELEENLLNQLVKRIQDEQS